MCDVNPFQMLLQAVGAVAIFVFLGALFLIRFGGVQLDKLFPEEDTKGRKP